MNNEGQNAQPIQGAGAAAGAAAAANNQMVNQLETIFSNLKADIPVFYGDKTKDSVTTIFILYSLLWGRLREQIIQFI